VWLQRALTAALLPLTRLPPPPAVDLAQGMPSGALPARRAAAALSDADFWARQQALRAALAPVQAQELALGR
jgi:hypothetical protein